MTPSDISEVPFTLHLTIPVRVLDSVTTPIRLADASSLGAVADLLALVDEHSGPLEIRLTGTEDLVITESLRQFCRLVSRIRLGQGLPTGAGVHAADGLLVITVDGAPC